MFETDSQSTPLIALLLLFLIGLYNCQTVPLHPFITGMSVQAFSPTGPLLIYQNHTIFDYLNGEAEQYLQHGFKALYSQTYRMAESDAQLIVDAFEMNSPNQAQKVFNYYTMEEGAVIQQLGDNAWTDRYMVLIKRDTFFIRIWSDPTQKASTEPLPEDLLKLGREIDASLSRR